MLWFRVQQLHLRMLLVKHAWCILPAAYAAFTLSVTSWRSSFRRAMNRAEAEAAGRAVDALLNYETVKCFGAEKHEAQRWGARIG